MKTDWQSWGALGIVLITVGLAVLRMIKAAKLPKKPTPCRKNCGCGGKWEEKDFNASRREDASQPQNGESFDPKRRKGI